MTSLNSLTGVTFGPRYPLIPYKALATRPVSAAIANANFLAADQLRAKAGRTMVALCAGKGIASFAEAKGKRVRSGANNCSPWFCPICGAKALCGKEAFLLQAFWLLCGYKVTGLGAAKSATA